MISRTVTLVTLLALAAQAFGGPQTAPAAHTARTGRVDPRAAAIMEQMRATYQKMRSFSVKVGTYYGIGLGTDIEIKRPDKARVTAYGPDRDLCAICDGRSITAYDLKDPLHYVRVAVPPGGGALFQTAVMAHSPAFFTAALLSANRPLDFQSLTLEPPGELDAVRVQKVRAKFRPQGEGVPGMAVDVELRIGEADHLLRLATITFQQGDSTTTATEAHGDKVIKVNPDLPDALFTFTPPPGAKRVTELPSDPQYYDPNLTAGGAPAPLHATDIAGRAVNLRADRGRVVLLDYWATWCAPCLGELPYLRAAYAKYHGHCFDIVSVSLDDQATGPRLAAFTKQHGMTWPQVCDGKGFDSPLAAPYKVAAIPFSLLIGRDGKIAAVNPRGAELDAAVRAALARK